MNKLKLFFFSVLIFITLYLVYFTTYTFVEPKIYDFMVRKALTEKLPFDNNKNVYGHDDIVLVITDMKTVQKYRWPWKREVYCKVLNYFSEYAKPKVFVHDSVLHSLDENYPESDKKYFDSIKKYQNMVEGFLFNIYDYENKEFGKKYDKLFVDKFGIETKVNSTESSKLYDSLLPMPEEYISAVNHAGSVFIVPGFIDGNLSRYARDEVFRYQEYFVNYKGVIIPSLAMQAFLIANNNPIPEITNDQVYFPDLNYKINHKTTKYNMMIAPIRFYKFRKHSSYSHIMYSARDIMDSYDNLKQGKAPIIDPTVFKDKIVVYGANVPAGDGLNDNKTTPIAKVHPGADIQATNIDNLIHNDFLKVIPLWINIIFMLFMMLGVYATIRTHSTFKAVNYSIMLMFLIFLISYACFYNGIVVLTITPIVMCIVTMIIAYIHRYVIEEKQKEKVENAMGKYMSEDVMKRVIQNIDNLGLGGKKAIVTVLFSDIRGFTSMSENMTAQEVSQLLNEYFSEMEPLVTKYNGIINKFIGDAVMAVFGEPIQDDNHPINAIKCGFEMLKKVDELNKKWEKENKPKINIGIGINTGEVFVGNIGSEKRMEYTVIGDTVNLASRLEGYNKIYKTHILVSSSTYEKCANLIKVNKISDVEIRGKANKMDIYEILYVELQTFDK